jgi:ABC-2 type transport system permease protein
MDPVARSLPGTAPSPARSLLVQLRVLAVVVRKEWTVFWRYPLNAVMRVIEPVMWLAPIYFLGRSFTSGGSAAGFAASTGTGNFLSFVLLGGIVGSYISAVFWGLGWSLKQEMDQGTLESLWMTPNPRVLLLVGRSVVSIVLTALTTAGVLTAAYLLFGFRLGGDFWAALLLLIPTVLALYGFGIAYSGVVLLLREANTLTDVGSYAIQILSGYLNPVTVLPRALLVISLTLPVTYALDAMRALVLGTRPLVPIGVSTGIILLSVPLFVAWGRYTFDRVEARVRKQGTLGMH